ncbi:similar to cytochrome P450 alkane hydroxylase [Botrytis cinerea T4]|uniref:Similar to cytochrome P450 alkane hydroxylase n=1 Tax=Botryotinia fuckeliana (strain T4) TaxID=999810 RepID=G2YW37_BOTF4|nr:similar to cytochrome P450 alkane hydroxylase [Botrytis cinerea T4]
MLYNLFETVPLLHIGDMTSASFWVAFSLFFYFIANRIYKSHVYSAKLRKFECQDPVPKEIISRWPFGLDIVKSALEADRKKLYPVLLQRNVERFGTTWKYTLMNTSSVFTADPKNLKAVLATQFEDFDLGPMRIGAFWPMLGKGIFTQDGHEWRVTRDMMRPQFNRDQMSSFEVEETHVQNLMRAIDTRLQGEWTEEIDLQVLFFRLTMDSATEVLLGESADSQLLSLPENQAKAQSTRIDFAAEFDNALSWVSTRGRFADKYWLVTSKCFKNSCNKCNEYVDHFVQLALKRNALAKDQGKDDSAATKKRYIYLDALAKETQDPIELRSQCLHLMLAGRDTTASLLGWLFLLFAQNPNQYQKLRNIIIENFGTYENPSEMTFLGLKNCRHLQNCLNEALRLYPLVPINVRQANKDTTLPCGGGKDGNSKVFIPKGSIVEYSVFVMHRRKDIWGDDAEEFRPERWEGRKAGWDFLPFNGGARICIGQQFALNEAGYVTARILQRFDMIRDMATDPVVKHELKLTDSSANGVKVKLHASTA